MLLTTSDFQEVFELPPGLGAAVAGSWSPDGRRVAFGLDRGDVNIWNLAAVQTSLAEHGFPWQEMEFPPPAEDPAISQMIRLGSRTARSSDPQQWKRRFNLLMQQLDQGADRTWVLRESDWLAKRLGHVANRPFFESDSNDAEMLNRMGDVYNLAMRLRERKEFDAQQSLLRSAQLAYQQLDAPTVEITRHASLLYHASGDLHNFHDRNRELCLQAYEAEEELLNQLLTHPYQPQPESSLATNLFWLHRNLALATQKFGDLTEASRRMKVAIDIADEFPNLQVEPEMIEDARTKWKHWLEQ
jgi:hypothetical protein